MNYRHDMTEQRYVCFNSSQDGLSQISASSSIHSSADTKWVAVLTGWCTCGKMNVQKYFSQQNEKWLFVEISQITDEMAAEQ